MILPISAFIILTLAFFQRNRSWRISVLFASTIFGFLVFLGTEFLGLFKLLNRGGLLVFWGIVFSGTFVWFLITKKDWRSYGFEWHFAELQWHDYIVGTGTIFLVLINAIAAFHTPPNNWDSMVYHLPRVMHWLDNQSVDFYATHIQRQLFMSPGNEYFLLHIIGITGSDKLVNIFSIILWIGSALLVSLLVKEMEGNWRAQWVASLFCLLIPTSILQAGTPKNDLLLGVWVLSALIYGKRFIKSPSYPLAAKLGAAIGLAVLTKTTAFVILAPFGLWFAIHNFHQLKQRFFMYGGIITLIVLIICTPHFLRNAILFDSLLGPKEETIYYHNEIFGVRVLFSNSIRNLSMHLRGPEKWNDRLLNSIESLHKVIGIDPSDKRTTWPGYTFDIPPLRFNEDELGAPIHVTLFLIGIICMIIPSRKKNKTKQLFLFALLIVMAFLLFSGYLRWQLWQVRLMLSLIIMSSVVISLFLVEKYPAWISNVLVFIMILFGAVSIWKNPTKPLPGFYDYNIFNLKYPLMMIYDLSIQEDYMDAIEFLKDDLDCSQIGMVMDNADWEYPFWAILSKEMDDIHIQHINVHNRSNRYEETSFQPCAILVMTQNRPDDILLPNGDLYTPVLFTSEINLYVP